MMPQYREIDFVEPPEIVAGRKFPRFDYFAPLELYQARRLRFGEIMAIVAMHLNKIIMAVISYDRVRFARFAAIGDNIVFSKIHPPDLSLSRRRAARPGAFL
jgi:hypothetical protein